MLTFRLLSATHTEILGSVNSVLATKDASLKRAWESQYGPGLDMDLDPNVTSATSNLKVTNNVVQFYNALPPNSVVRTSALNQLFDGVATSSVCDLLSVKQRTVYRAREAESKPLEYYLTNLGIPRDRLGEAEDWAVVWLDALQEPSGKPCKCYIGLFKSMYAEYLAWCVKKKYPPVCPEILDRIRRDRRIWILKGDIFLVCFFFSCIRLFLLKS